jgi:hypothetical protein
VPTLKVTTVAAAPRLRFSAPQFVCRYLDNAEAVRFLSYVGHVRSPNSVGHLFGGSDITVRKRVLVSIGNADEVDVPLQIVRLCLEMAQHTFDLDVERLDGMGEEPFEAVAVALPEVNASLLLAGSSSSSIPPSAFRVFSAMALAVFAMCVLLFGVAGLAPGMMETGP